MTSGGSLSMSRTVIRPGVGRLGSSPPISLVQCRWPPTSSSTLVESTRQALLAAFLVDERRLAAFLAEIADLLARLDDGRHGRVVSALHLADVLGEGARQRVGQ